MSIGENIERVREQIARAAKKSGRTPEDITLIAVSKTVEMPRILEAAQAGMTHFGENKAQELNGKYPQLPDAQWHMIGHLQTNKIKYIIDKAALIHSVDSIHLLDAIDRQAEKAGRLQKVLVQLNLTGEESKFGIGRDELPSLLAHAETLGHVKICGLMTIGSAFYTMDENKKIFEICNKIFVDIQTETYHNISMDYLSMGMTHDFEAAIEMGSNMVRVGTGIFGARNYNI